jgi:general L-amino acid transport system permease protein
MVSAIIATAFVMYRQIAANLAERGIATGFGFLFREAGIAIGEVLPLPVLVGPGAAFLAVLTMVGAASWAIRLLSQLGPTASNVLRYVVLACAVMALVAIVTGSIEIRFFVYSQQDTFGFALLTGLSNTVKAGVTGIILASLVGLLVGLGRLSSNLLVRSAATVYVETLRNVPLLIQVFFWYFGVLRALPPVRNSVEFLGVAALNNRGVFLPRPEAASGLLWLIAAVSAAIAFLFWLRRRAQQRQQASGQRPAIAIPFLSMLLVLCSLAWLFAGAPFTWSFPARVGFNFQGGLTLTPEFAALVLGISLYTGAFIAEIVRSGVQGVSRSQWEAARSLGLSDGRILRLVILPQAMRVIFPPLISQYLSLVKDSSLGIAIAYPELVSVSNTTINQTGQPIEILAITIGTFMAMNLLISALINWYNEARPWATH